MYVDTFTDAIDGTVIAEVISGDSEHVIVTLLTANGAIGIALTAKGADNMAEALRIAAAGI